MLLRLKHFKVSEKKHPGAEEELTPDQWRDSSFWGSGSGGEGDPSVMMWSVYKNIKCRKTLQTLRFFLKWQKFVAFPLYYPSAAPWQFWKTASFNPPSPVRKSWQVFRTFKELGSTSIYKNFFFFCSQLNILKLKSNDVELWQTYTKKLHSCYET